MINYIPRLIKDIFSSTELKKLRADIQYKNSRNIYLENELKAARIIINSKDSAINNLCKRVDYLEDKYIFNPEPKKKEPSHWSIYDKLFGLKP